MYFPRLSDVGSDREADSSLDFSRLFEALDRSRVSTPRKVGTLPFVPRLDKPDQAVPTGEVSAMAEETISSPDRAASRMNLSTPSPVPAPRPSTLSGSRRQTGRTAHQIGGDFLLSRRQPGHTAHQIAGVFPLSRSVLPDRRRQAHTVHRTAGVSTLSRSTIPDRMVDVGSEEECRSLPAYVHLSLIHI